MIENNIKLNYLGNINNPRFIVKPLKARRVWMDNNPEKYALIKKNNDEFGKGFLLPFKQMIANYMDTKDENVLNNAVKFYIVEFITKYKQI